VVGHQKRLGHDAANAHLTNCRRTGTIDASSRATEGRAR
jgi:hypothetical protein